MQFWDAPSNSRSSRSETDSNQELVQQQTEGQLAEDQQAAEHQSPLAGEKNSVEIEGSGEQNNSQPCLRGSAYTNFTDTPGVRSVPEDGSALGKGLQQADHPRASGFYSTQSGLFSYQGSAEQGSRGILSLSRRLEAAAESNSQAAGAGAAAAPYNVDLSFSGTFPQIQSHRLNPYFLHHRQNQQSYGATAVVESKAQAASAAFGDTAAYGSAAAGAISLQQQHQQQFLAEVGSSEMPDVVDPSAWRIQGTGAQPEAASPTSACSGEKSERRKRKCESEETSAKPYACRFCSQSFDKSQALGGHMNRHRQEREREQLDNAQKLVLKQQGLQGLSGLPLQNLNSRAKVQGPSPLVSFEHVTLGTRYNQAAQYQHPRTFLTGTGIHANPYSNLHSSALLNNPGAWNNLGSYVVGGGTGSIASGSTVSHMETARSSNLARVVSGATPEDLFAASVLQSATATASPQLGRCGETTDNQGEAAEPEMMYGYPGVATLTPTDATTSGPETSPCVSVPHAQQSLVSSVQLYGGLQNQGGQALPQLDISHLDGEED